MKPIKKGQISEANYNYFLLKGHILRSFENITVTSMRLVISLLVVLGVGCASKEKSAINYMPLIQAQCVRVMGEDTRQFIIDIEVSSKKLPDGSYPTKGRVNSRWKNNPKAGVFRDEITGVVWFLNQGTLLRLSSTKKLAYFNRLDAWLGYQYLVRSRFEHSRNQFKTLSCRAL